MKEIKCSNCGGNSWIEEPGFRQCAFCGSRFQLTAEDVAIKSSTIAVNDDVERLLEKCADDPENAARYANLILDIDPGNRKAKKILRGW